MKLENNPKLTETCMWLADVTGTDLHIIEVVYILCVLELFTR